MHYVRAGIFVAKKEMRQFISRLSILIPALCMLVACRPEDRPAEETATTPQCLIDLVTAFESGAKYYGVTQTSTVSKVFFIGGDVMVPRSDLDIEDCTGGREPKAVSLDGSGKWKVGDKVTDIARTENGPSSSFPVYAYFDEKQLVVYTSSGDILSFDNMNYEEPADPEVPGGDDPGKEEPPTPPSSRYEIPKVYLYTDGQARITSKEDYVPGSIRIEDPSCAFSDVRVMESRMNIRGRGNTTWGMPKKPYKIKLEEKEAVLGMKKDKEWALLANYDDKTLLRNIMAMEISRRLGFSWTPGMVSAEVWLNGEYQGVYSFAEHKKVSKNRVNIDVATPENNSGEGLTGGYYMEFENESINEPTYFKTTRYGVTLMLHEPEIPTPEQLSWLVNYIESFENTLYALGHDDRGPTNYADYIDVNSFVNYYILEELAKDPDANFRKSTFLTKEKGKKLELYHVWDFDITFGNCNYWGNGLIPGGFVLKDCVWYNRLFGKDRTWIEAVQKRWKEVYPLLETIPLYIDEQVRLLDGAQDRNFSRWPILGQYVWPNAVWYGTYQEEISYLKDFYLDRLSWLDAEIEKL